MKKFAIVLLLGTALLLTVTSVWAFEQIPYAWVEINPMWGGAGTNTGITSDDQNVGPFNLNFTFPSYTNFTSIRVCSNGFASFTSTAVNYTNNPIPTSSEPNNLVAPYWDDMNPSSYGTVWYRQDATNGRFIVQWDSCAHFSTNGVYYFQAILYTGHTTIPDGTIDFMYKELTPGDPNSATVGIEDASGTNGVQTTFNGSGPLEPDTAMGIRIHPASSYVPVTLSSFDASVVPGGVALSWKTASELDCYGWYVQRDEVDVSPLIEGYGTTEEPHEYAYMDPVSESGTYTYRLKQIDIGGAVTFSNPITVNAGVAEVTEYALKKNFPNPFNPTTTIGFDLLEAGNVTLTIYDINGQMVAKVVDGWYMEGSHETVFDATGLSSGVYIYDLTAGSFKANGKMVMMK